MRTRFAQDPADRLNIDSARVAIFNYLFAKRYGGTFVLRVDDTEKNNEFATKQIFDDLKWLGINWDEGPIYQSNRQAHYRDVARSLIREGLAYPDDGDNEFGDKTAYRGSKRNLQPDIASGLWDDTGWPLRFKIDNEDHVVLDDLIKGQVRWDVCLLHDPVIMVNGSATSLFASVVDDAEMKISHVIRDENELNDTPAQVLLATAMDYVPPFFAHVPGVHVPLDNLGSTSEVRAKFKELGFSAQEILSREELNPINISYYQTLGYKPDALINYLVDIGSPEQVVASKNRLCKEFTLKQVSPGRFDSDQLMLLAGEHTKLDSLDTKIDRCAEFLKFAKVSADPAILKQAVALCGDLIKVYSDILTRGLFFFVPPMYDQYDVDRHLSRGMRNLFRVLTIRLKHCRWAAADIENTVQEFAVGRESKPKDIVTALSVAITGRATGPCVFHVMEIIGREKCLGQIQETLNFGELKPEDYI